MEGVVQHSLFTDFDISLFKAGKHFRLWEKFGSHPIDLDGKAGVYFAVYAPGAKTVSVVGDFNSWDESKGALFVRWDSSGIWEGFVEGAKEGQVYKYYIRSYHTSERLEKADPYARLAELPPNNASFIHQTGHKWSDKDWMVKRKARQALGQPLSVYELHIGSWKWNEAEDRPMTYRELANHLPAYLSDLGFTHVELMPVMEHPYPPSWGYQITGFFAPTSRFGKPEDFKFLVNALHKAGIGVILDWVPSHFPSDAFGLANFDGSSVYEHPDRSKGYHPDWQSLIFNYERAEVRAFLISNAGFWLEEFHIDGLRVDAVASMLYLDYSREEWQWQPNEFGGREYLAAIAFLKELNAHIYASFPDIHMIAEESTAFYGVSKPTDQGGLGFGLKWMMGWMNDTLMYFQNTPVYRKFHQGVLSFSIYYFWSENFILPLSHDEVVHGKGSLLSKMPGTSGEQFANLRLLLSYMWLHPGGKLLFMGGEIAQRGEWRYNAPLDWHLTQFDSHLGVQDLVRTLNGLYKNESALHELEYSHEGFEWIDYGDADNSVLSFIRKGSDPHDQILVLLNFTPVTRENYRLGVPDSKSWKLLFNSDDTKYWGQGIEFGIQVNTLEETSHNRTCSADFTLPGLSATVYKMVPKPTKAIAPAKKEPRNTSSRTTAAKAGKKK